MPGGCNAICKAIQQNTTLREIFMSNNFIGPEGAKHVAKVLQNKKYITEIWLSMNGIFVDGAISLGEALKDKKYLEVLVLKRNDIGIHGMRALKEVLFLSKTIKELNLAGNKIGDEGCIMACDALLQKTNQSLTYLNLADNQITCEGANKIAEVIRKCKTLRELFLSNNKIANDGARQIAAALKTRKNFQTIDIDNNKFSGQAILELFSIMPVGKLNLVKQKLSDEEARSMSQTISMNKSLSQIYLSHNELTEVGLGYFADALAQNRSLTDIYITHNDLSGTNGQRLLSTLKQKQYLKTVALNNCKVNKQALTVLTDAIGDNENLKELYLYSNEITEFNDCKNLGMILLNKRKLTAFGISNNRLGEDGAVEVFSKGLVEKPLLTKMSAEGTLMGA